jgi:hypothetical protein
VVLGQGDNRISKMHPAFVNYVKTFDKINRRNVMQRENGTQT